MSVGFMNENWGPKIKNKQALNEDVQQTGEVTEEELQPLLTALETDDTYEINRLYRELTSRYGIRQVRELIRPYLRDRSKPYGFYFGQAERSAAQHRQFLNKHGKRLGTGIDPHSRDVWNMSRGK